MPAIIGLFAGALSINAGEAGKSMTAFGEKTKFEMGLLIKTPHIVYPNDNRYYLLFI